jgi:hypothetical protein
VTHEFDLTKKLVSLYEMSLAVEPHVMSYKRPIALLCFRNRVAVCGVTFLLLSNKFRSPTTAYIASLPIGKLQLSRT